jgi:hypothetical protein
MVVSSYLLGMCEAYSPTDDVVASSVCFYNVMYTFCMMCLVGTWMWSTYQFFMILWSFVAFSSKEYTKMSQFVQQEYQAGKVFTQSEYQSGKIFAAGEFAQFKMSVLMYLKFCTVLSAVGTFCSVAGLFKSNTFTMPTLAPQGFRQDVNKSGMFMTGLLSLCVLCLAPIYGAEKILKMIEPVIGCLKKIPYATWLMSWVGHFKNGEFCFDDLPQYDGDWKEVFGGMDAADKMQEAIKEINKMGAANFAPEKQPGVIFVNPDQKEKEPMPVFTAKEDLVNLDGDDVYTLSDGTIEINCEPGCTEELCTPECKERQLRVRTKISIKMALNPKPAPKIDQDVAAKIAIETPKPRESPRPPPDLSKMTDVMKERLLRVRYGINFDKSKLPKPVDKPLSADQKLDILEEMWEKTEEQLHVNEEVEIAKAVEAARFMPGVCTTPQCYKEHCLKEHGFCFETFYTEQLKPCACWIIDEILSTPADIMSYFGWDNGKKVKANYDEAYHETVKACMAKVEVSAEDAVRHLHKEDIKIEENTDDGFKKTRKVKINLNTVYKCQENAGLEPTTCYGVIMWQFAKKHSKVIFKGLLLTMLILSATRVASDPISAESPFGEEPMLFAPTQAKGKTNTVRGGNRPAETTQKKRKNVWNDVSPGGSENNLYAEPEAEDLVDSHHDYDPRNYTDDAFSNRYMPKRRMPGQAVNMPAPRQVDEHTIRNKIARSRKGVVAPAKDIQAFIVQAREVYSRPMMPQAFNVSELSEAVYKFYRFDNEGKYTYLCTGTHIGNKLWVVLHSMSEDFSVSYRAVNHVRVIDFKACEMRVFGEQLACFPMNGIKAILPANKLRKLEDAAIVTILGFGHGLKNYPDSVTGFASPLGWCNAPTRDGDCTSPVLDCNGNVVGFWTHGLEAAATSNESFGRFEKVTDELIAFAKEGPAVVHSGLDFQLRPHSQ